MTVIFEQTQPIDYLTRLAASDFGRGYKVLVVRELAVAQGHRVIDLGCGPGADLRAFADAVGPAGVVIGVDNDDAALEQARRLTADLPNVELLSNDIRDIDVPDGCVERAHTDRVLQHVAEPARVLGEVSRMLTARGRATFAEPDWDTLVIDYPDPAVPAAYRRFITEQVVRNARVGRQLPRLAQAAGLVVERVVPVTATFREADKADKVFGFHRVTQRAVAAGYLSAEVGREWLDYLASAPFFAAASLFVVTASRP
jgi:ubiquinone/menaquinone biosynthesis C-methylase UbiE